MPTLSEEIEELTQPGSYMPVGFSSDSLTISRELQQNDICFTSALSIKPKSDELRYELHEKFLEFLDGCGNDAGTIYRARASTDIALRIIRLFPESVLSPEISYDEDGDISFDWIQSKRKMLSLCITPNGNIYYSLLNGQSRARGKEFFDASFPVSIHSHLERLFSDPTQNR